MFVQSEYNVQSVKKKRNAPTNFNKMYRREMKLVPINMDYSLLQFGALKLVLEVFYITCLQLTLIFSMESPKFDYKIVKFILQIA